MKWSDLFKETGGYAAILFLISLVLTIYFKNATYTQAFFGIYLFIILMFSVYKLFAYISMPSKRQQEEMKAKENDNVVVVVEQPKEQETKKVEIIMVKENIVEQSEKPKEKKPRRKGIGIVEIGEFEQKAEVKETA